MVIPHPLYRNWRVYLDSAERFKPIHAACELCHHGHSKGDTVWHGLLYKGHNSFPEKDHVEVCERCVFRG